MFELECGFSYIKQPKCQLNRDLIENGSFRWKTENPCLKNFSGVTGQKLALGEVEESQGFPEVKHSKSQNVFIIMDSLGQDISGTIFSFQIEHAKTQILWLEDFSRQPN